MGLSVNDWLAAIGNTAVGAGAGSVISSRNEADKNKHDDQQQISDQKTKWDEDRGYVNNEWAGLLSEYGSAAFAGRAITAQDPFETMSHQAIYDALQGVDSNAINTVADGWRNLAKDGRTAVDEYSKGVERSITEHWTGKSGSGAIDATREFAQTFTKLAASFQMVGHGLDLTQGHLAQAKGSVPKPDSYTTGDKLIDMLPGQNVIKGPTYRAQEAESNARFAMTEYYRPGVNEVDGITPILPEPTSTVDKNNPDGPNNNPNSNQPGSPNSNNPSGSPDTTDKKTTDDSKKQDSTVDPSTQPASTDPSDTTDKKTTNTTPASTTPANTPTDDPSKTKTPSTPSTPSNNHPTTTFPGSPSRTPGTPSSTTPAPGKSIPGKAGTPSTTAATTAARSASSGKPGTAGAPGMGAGAGRGKGDEDGEHKTPDYLIYDRGSELLGTQPPALPPGGVIGG
ncbi:hypothetical protein F3087_20740 [Nocardia colli]|uniref:PPE domain-containing protein n=1 Tax=Nocardia colli TaxID=2545717 RepID=A0A5N0EGS4_9NOCA|nr:hypothetical protein [Nocardia colli]KAA8887315.1 hypothetical protein F3087_20740 [Nocardia colli]